jgi:hypothetical protein
MEMMDKKDKELLEKYGWTVECYSPFEISTEDGSFAIYEAAQYVLDGVRREDADTGERQLTILDVSVALSGFRKWQKENWEEIYLMSDEFMIKTYLNTL